MSKLLSKSTHSGRLSLDGCTIIPRLTVPPTGDMFKFPRLLGGGISYSKLLSVPTNFNFQLDTYEGCLRREPPLRHCLGQISR